MPRIFHAPHRLFFFAAVVQILLASAWWAITLALRARGMPAPLGDGLEPGRVHALLMIYGFLPLFAFGFLDTAGPKWLGVPGPQPEEYVPAGVTSAFAATLLFVALPLLLIWVVATSVAVWRRPDEREEAMRVSEGSTVTRSRAA